MYEGTVESIEFVSPTWFKLKLKEFNRPIMIHFNWFLKHGNIYPIKGGYAQNVLKPGDKIRFVVSEPTYPSDKENLYVKDVEIMRSSVLEVDAL